MAENSILTKTEIIIQDYNDNSPVVFSNLSLNEALINVNNFAFSLRPADTNGSFGAILDFKKKVLGKNVQIDFKDGAGNSNHKFNGIILEVNSFLVDNQYYEFSITGKGSFCKVNEIAECHSFYKKKLADIIDKSFEKSNLKDKVNKDPQTIRELHYTVQYNQTLFSFVSTLAIRFGEWMFYDGEKLQFGKKPDGNEIELKSPADVNNLNIRAQAIKKPESGIATDIFKSEKIESKTAEESPENDFIKAAEESGSSVYENPGGNIFLPSGFKQEQADDIYKLEQQAIYSSSVLVTGNTRNNKLSVGKIVKIKDPTDDAGKKFIITQINHFVSNYSSYNNSFSAVPFEVTVPPYTNPLLETKATPQAAIITDNEDDSGLSRVKVKFPWMADDEKSPWISVLAPHAGKDKGFRFLPEKDDEVMVDFWNNNAEMPFVNGALYTKKNQSGIAQGGNNQKLIGSKSGRRLEINDDSGSLIIRDNFPDQNPANIIALLRNDSEKNIFIESKESNQNFSVIRLNNQDSLDLGIVQGGVLLAEINLEKAGPKITIHSKGVIEINADQKVNISSSEINLNASNININADSKLEMKGTSEAKLSGTQIKIEADATLEAKGAASAKVESDAIMEVKGGAMAKIQGAIVMIN
ncbi:MAG: hypothetical protein IPH58_10055 [Sphingobacteriales bacterium]|jgi:type VI secretion system secreted protein VgrG|nr:hypothetical protein [Sphingobacteriales bacterium]